MKGRPAKHFSWDEVRCRHCGTLPDVAVQTSDEFGEFTRLLDVIRDDLGKPIIVTSWYRCAEHPLEVRKKVTGAHRTGLAVDVLAANETTQCLVWSFLENSNHLKVGIGFAQRGPIASRFLHLDIASESQMPEFKTPRPACWGY